MYLLLPITFLKFWYLEAPISLLRYLASMDNAFLHMLSLPLFVRTFFKPLKNEYRGDLVGFSVAMGMGIKLVLILVGISLFFIMILLEIAFFLLFLALPIITLLTIISLFLPTPIDMVDHTRI